MPDAIIEKANGEIDQVEIPEDCNAATVKAAIKAILPVVKAHGESFGQSIRDAMEESLEKIAKAQEQNLPINRDPNADPPERSLGGSIVGGDTVISKEDKPKVMSLFFKSLGRNISKGSPQRAEQYIKDGDHGFDKRIKEFTLRAMSESDISEAGMFVPETIRSTIRELKDEAIIMRQVAPEPLRIRGGITIPKEAVLATAFWKDESEELTITSFKHAMETLTLKKLTVLIAASNEALKDAVNFDRIIERHMRRAYGRKLEPAYWYGDGTGASPKGLRYLVDNGNVFTRTAAPTVQTITNDLVEAKFRVRQGQHDPNAGMGDAFIINSTIWAGLMQKLTTDFHFGPFATEMIAGRLHGTTLFETDHLPATLGGGTDSEVFYVIRDYINLYEGEAIELDASRDASYRDSDNTVKSAFSYDQTVYRLISREEIGLEYADGASVITVTNSDWKS